MITLNWPDGSIKNIVKSSITGYDEFPDNSIEIYFVGGSSLYIDNTNTIASFKQQFNA